MNRGTNGTSFSIRSNIPSSQRRLSGGTCLCTELPALRKASAARSLGWGWWDITKSPLVFVAITLRPSGNQRWKWKIENPLWMEVLLRKSLIICIGSTVIYSSCWTMWRYWTEKKNVIDGLHDISNWGSNLAAADLSNKNPMLRYWHYSPHGNRFWWHLYPMGNCCIDSKKGAYPQIVISNFTLSLSLSDSLRYFCHSCSGAATHGPASFKSLSRMNRSISWTKESTQAIELAQVVPWNSIWIHLASTNW